MRVKNILVLCTGNSCRSQIAEAYLKHFAKDKAIIYSAGIEAHGLNPNAVASMKEDGIDISQQTSNLVDEYRSVEFDLVITVCDNAKERCPFFAGGVKKFHNNFPDPAKAKGSIEEIKAEFSRVRQMIKNYCREFVERELSGN
jgi:arsenate reductase